MPVIRFIVLRILVFPVVLLAANFFGYWFAAYFGPLQAAYVPYSMISEGEPILAGYGTYLGELFNGNAGLMATGEPIPQAIWRAFSASAGLLFISLGLSAIIGVLLGMWAVHSDPPRVSSWMTVISTLGLAAPGFYIAILFVAFSVMYVIWGPTKEPLFPFQGFGWDAHLVLPTLALMTLPTVKVAQVTAGMMAGEMGKQYVVAARSFGHTLATIRRRHVFRNIIVPVVIVISGVLRFLVAELVIIERLFSWPGLGRLFSTVLVSGGSNDYLSPPLLAALITTIAFIFLATDLATTLIARRMDPRMGEG